MKLSPEERRDLRSVLVVVLPERAALWTTEEESLNGRTLELTEQFLTECTKCTKAMQRLILDLAGGLTRGWLRRALKTVSKGLDKDEGMWRGNVACYVTSKAYYGRLIEESLY